jgi:hypothetical protein
MYPTVCSLQGLWSFVIGEGFTHRDATAEIQAFVAAATPEMLQDPDAWRYLTAVVEVRPDADLFPVRAPYASRPPLRRGAAQKAPRAPATIALNPLSCDRPLWFTVADCLAAKFLSGKPPQIEQAIFFEAGPPQAGLKPITLLGRHTIDPYEEDFYRELIRARRAEEDAKIGKSEAEQERIEEIRDALKITANSTSYGIFVQFNVNTAPGGATVRIYRPDGSSFAKRTEKIETPGPWFNPLVATLITGAARLMLALAEHQTLKAGLGWAFCDTDSLAIARPDGTDDETFLRGADAVIDWFKPLNPYGFAESILKKEKANFAADGSGEPVPLFCWAISSKRYALFNIGPDGQPVIRKASAHGLGHLRSLYPDEDAPACFPTPLPAVLAGREKLQRWHHDVWFAILKAALSNRPDHVDFDYHPGLSKPTVSPYAATSPEILGWFDPLNAGKPYADQVKPFGFLNALHVSKFARHPDDIDDPLDEAVDDGEIHPMAPFDVDLEKAVAKAFDRVTGRPIDPSILQTYAEVLVGYPHRAEAKFLNGRPFDTGVTERRHVMATAVEFIGKEADRWEEEFYLGMSGRDAQLYGQDPKDSARAHRRLSRAIDEFGKSAVAEATGISRTTAAKIEGGRWATTPIPHHQILAGLDELRAVRSAMSHARERKRAELVRVVEQEGGIRPAARKLGVDPSNLSKKVRR